jgi:cytochrome c
MPWGENKKPDYSQAKSMRVPQDDRFVMEVLADNLYEPTELAILPDGKVLFTGRRGTLTMYDPEKRTSRAIAQIPVYNGHEDGLMGLALDPGFQENHYLYLYYSPVGEDPKQHLSRFTFRGDSLVLASEKVILVVETQRDECCHTGGSIEFGPDGLLFLSTGDDTNPFETGYAPINEMEGRSPWDAQKSSANPYDLRGKILRIQPTEDGGYAIPEGNLFPEDGSQGRPEIYVMGCRNPYRIHVDQKTGYLYWGDVGPDARVDSSRGPRGYDEVNQAREAGFFGWPYFVGNNYAYRDVDFASQTLGDWFDPAKPVNTSSNNPGANKQLPPAQPAFIWYPYLASPDFPIVREGGRNAMAGPVFYHDRFAGTPSQFPKYYDGKLFIYDFIRDWIFAVTMYENGDLEKIEPFLPDLKLSSPIDMEFGPDGALYILEYGTRWFAQNQDARLIRIDYKEGNRAPIPEIAADRRIGAAPFTVNFTAAGSRDYDPGDELTYRWEFPGGETATGETASFTFREAGVFHPKVIVSDQNGESSERSLAIQVGNDPPVVELSLTGNRSFFWKEQGLDYAVEVNDKEDGSTTEGSIPAEAVSVSFDFLDNSQDPTEQAQGHAAMASAAMIAAGKELIATYGCVACHDINKAIQGPSYLDVSQKYQTKDKVMDYLVGKILNGGMGVWGEAAMPAQAQVSEIDASKMAAFILSLANQKPAPPSLPLTGSLKLDQHRGNGYGSTYTLQVSYRDQGGTEIGPLEAYQAVTLRSPRIRMTESDQGGTQNMRTPRVARGSDDRFGAFRHNGIALFKDIDLTGIPAIDFRYRSFVRGAKLEIRADAVDGPLLGSLVVNRKPSSNFFTETVAIQPSKGKHDLYLVVKHEVPEDFRGPSVGVFWMHFQPPVSL